MVLIMVIYWPLLYSISSILFSANRSNLLKSWKIVFPYTIRFANAEIQDSGFLLLLMCNNISSGHSMRPRSPKIGANAVHVPVYIRKFGWWLLLFLAWIVQWMDDYKTISQSPITIVIQPDITMALLSHMLLSLAVCLKRPTHTHT